MNHQGFVLMVALVTMSILSVLTLFQIALIDANVTFLEYMIRARLGV